jgi:hypothetical protein
MLLVYAGVCAGPNRLPRDERLLKKTRKSWPPNRGWTGWFIRCLAPRPAALALDRESIAMNIAAEVGTHLTGLEQMRALLVGGRRPGIGQSLDFQLVEVAEGRAVFEGTPGLHIQSH